MNIKEDVLGRQGFVAQIINIVEKISNEKKSCSFAIEGKWGLGKSFVLDLFEKQINSIQSEETSTNKYMIFHYNCWRYDYYEEPSVSIVASMLEKIEEEESLLGLQSDAFLNAGWKKAKILLADIAGEFTKNKIGINLVRVAEDIRDDVEKTIEEEKAFDELFSFRKTLDKTRNKLEELSEEKTIVFVVDELDRCLPSYMIKVLERLHHLFSDINNIIVVLAIDSEQLERSVYQIYGNGKQVNDYLKKFIDFTLILNQGEIDNRIEEKYNLYFTKFENLNIENKQSLLEILKIIYNVDIRTQEKLISKAEIIHNLVCDKEKPDASLLAFEMMWVLFSYKRKTGDLKWIPDINHTTYVGLKEDIGEECVQYLKRLEKSVGEKNRAVGTGSGDKRIIKNTLVDKIFWIFAAVYNETSDHVCSDYYYGQDQELVEEVEIAKEFCNLARVMK